MIKRVLLGLLALLLALVVAVAANTFLRGSRQIDVQPAPALAVDAQAVAESLAAAVRAKTIRDAQEPTRNAAEFDALHAHLAKRYPRVHAQLKREVVGRHALIYTWEGSDAKLPAVGLMAHQDVVPIAPGTESLWTVPPFDGRIQDGFVWGRGAWDDKSALIGELEAIETLLAQGFKPRRTVMLLFGDDEEIQGQSGAGQIVALLKKRGIRLDFVIDEGQVISENVVPGVQAPVALIGLAEKGFVSIGLKVTAKPGHSSLPPPVGNSAIAILSKALDRIENRQFPASLDGAARYMFAALAPEMNLAARIPLTNLWLFGPLVKAQFEKSAVTNALIRSTTALTVVHAGNKDNVLPGEANAVVNYRLLPGDTVASALAHVREVVADERVEAAALGAPSEPSSTSSADADSFRLVARTIREVFPGTVVAPGLTLTGTDAKYYSQVADQVYRFSPVKIQPADIARLHGTNERIAVANLADLVRFYHRLVQQAAQ